MKLATLDNGTRDGKLVVVSADLTSYAEAQGIAPTLQSALDNWSHTEPQLRALSEQLVNQSVSIERFRERDALSPLPRGYQWLDGSAYVNHVELVRRARGAELPESFWSDPLMYQGDSAAFLAPRADIPLRDVSHGADMEAEVAVIVDDVPMGISPDAALEHIKLVMLVNDVSLRGLIPAELAKGFGFVHGKPPTAFSPVAISPDALGDRWKDGKLHGQLHVDYNSEPFGRADAGSDMTFHFGQLIAHAAHTRPLSAGTIIGSGTVSNKLNDGPGKPISDGGVGYSCIAELRMIETINQGAPTTPFMTPGDSVRIEMLDDEHHSFFGAIDQMIVDAH